MTRNQIDYFNALEGQRSNKQRELETFRHNLETEHETQRANQAQETISIQELARKKAYDTRYLSEVERANRTKESQNLLSLSINRQQVAENVRHNRASELEMNRSNVAREIENTRSNMANETNNLLSLTNDKNRVEFTHAENVARQAETERHNLAMENVEQVKAGFNIATSVGKLLTTMKGVVR